MKNLTNQLAMAAMLGMALPPTFYSNFDPRGFTGRETTYLEPEPTEKTKEDYIRIAKAEAKRIRKRRVNSPQSPTETL